MTLPCQIGLRCPYSQLDGAECRASWNWGMPDRCPIVMEGSPLERKMDEEAVE